MNPSDFILPQQLPLPQTKSRSEIIVDEVSGEFHYLTATNKSDKLVKVECVTLCGVFTVVTIQAGECDLLRMEVEDASGQHSLLLTTTGQCSFRFQYVPASEEIAELKVLGFGEKPTAGNTMPVG